MPPNLTLHFALGQMVCRLGDVAGNLRAACDLSREAARRGARLIVLPEGCLTGNALTDPADQAVLPAEPEAFKELAAVAAACDITICAGFLTPFEGRFNTVQAIIEPDGCVRFQHKAFRASTEPAFIKAWPDPERVVFSVEGVRLAVSICSEYGSPGTQEALDRAAPDVVLHPSAGSMKPEEVWREGTEPSEAARRFEASCRSVIDRAAAKAKLECVPKIGSNPVGFDGRAWWPGNSYAVDGTGAVTLWVRGENRPAKMVSVVGVAEMRVTPRQPGLSHG